MSLKIKFIWNSGDIKLMGYKKGQPFPGESSMRALTIGERRVTGLGNLLISTTSKGSFIFWRRGVKGNIIRTKVNWEARRALKTYWD